MAANRLEMLRSMIAQNPENSFARYGLAMEQIKAGNLEEAIGEFRALIASDPNYSAAYFHAGQTYEKLSRLDDARTMYKAGIEVTSRNGDAHTRSELQGALDMLPI